MKDRTALAARELAGPGDPGAALRRNLPAAYRLASITLDDPILALTVVHDAAMTAWHTSSERPAIVVDAAFRRTLEAGCRSKLGERGAGVPHPNDAGEPLIAAIDALGAADRCALAREYGPAELSRPDGRGRRGSEWLGWSAWLGRPARYLAARRSTALRKRLLSVAAAGLHSGEASDESRIAARLRAVYASRDPGDDVPLDLRLRLHRSLEEAEEAAAIRAAGDRAAGWRFAINTFLLVLAGTVALALVSVTNLRANAQASAAPGGGPTSPLTITSVSVIQGDANGPGAHVAAARDALVVAYQGPAVWHASARQCLPDVAGTIDLSGRAQWPGSPAGHIASLVADPASGNVYAAGLGEYCDPGSRVSTNGGSTWSDGSLPSGSSDSPTWLGYDPAHTDTLLAAGDGVLSVSRDAGLTWAGSAETVAPIAFDPTGRLYGWGPGALFESRDDGSSWQRIGAGPATQPATGAAVPGGLLLGGPNGAWLYPIGAMPGMDGISAVSGPPALIEPGIVYSIAPGGDGAVILGADASGHPRLGTYSANASDAADTPFTQVTLSGDLAGLTVTGGQVAANSGGAAVTLTGAASGAAGTQTSTILYLTFAR